MLDFMILNNDFWKIIAIKYGFAKLSFKTICQCIVYIV